MLEPREFQWAQVVRQLREHLRMTRREFAELLGVTEATVYRWETGQCRPRPSYQEEIMRLWEEHMTTLPDEYEGWDYHQRKVVVILELEARGKKARIQHKKTIVVTGPPMREFIWSSYASGKIADLHVSPGHLCGSSKPTERTYSTQALDREYMTGEELQIFLSYEPIDSFLQDHEWQSFDVMRPSHHLELITRFSPERPPKDYSVSGLLGGHDIEVPQRVTKKETEQWIEFQWVVDNPKLRASYIFSWCW